MNDHLEGLLHTGMVGRAEFLRAAERHCRDHGVEWPRQEKAQVEFINRLHFAIQGQCDSCGCWWQYVAMSPNDDRRGMGCPSNHGLGHWICFAFTFAPPPFESGIEGRNVPPAANVATEPDWSLLESRRLQDRRRAVLEKFPNLMTPEDVEEIAKNKASTLAQEQLFNVLESMKDVPLSQMPYRLKVLVKKLRGEDEVGDDGERLAFGRTIDEGAVGDDE